MSDGPGTLVRHAVELVESPSPDAIDQGLDFGKVLISHEIITPERYQEFLSIHGSERAV
jgi:hypothetical protein